ncbi:MAG: hypothetical protein OEW08_12465 [Gammaproteobacteria bacterium]|nr:hypothetical protein [Gammaproteobacteria bacterium]
MVKLNKEQAKHLADTLRVVAVAEFGYFGYAGLNGKEWGMVAISTVAFILIEYLAFRSLEAA